MVSIEGSAELLRAILAEFMGAPTKKRQEDLLAAADAYREAWIEARAGEIDIDASRARQTSTPGSVVYEREKSARRRLEGTDVSLALQQRRDARTGRAWWVISWRATVSPSGRNRRFYFMRGGYWSLPLRDALELMLEMERLGALDDRYLDGRNGGDLPVIVSTEFDPKQRAKRLQEVTAKDEDWGEDPFFIIASDPDDQWRKVMLVNRETGRATFRSVTTSSTYRPKKKLRPGQRWWLDNTMMDANVQQMRHFLSGLRALLST